MTTLTLILCCTLSALALYQVLLASWFTWILLRARPAVVSDEQLPLAAILLPLRGADPHLAEGLKRLLDQDYPRYELHIVVDRREDPAWEVAAEVLRETGATNAQLSVVQQRSATCSPQCTALLQAVADLSPACEVVAIIDGDVLPHRAWLRELVAPLQDPTVGLTHGNRWFMPRDGHWGSLVRQLWNAGAVLPMHFLGIPWAGTLAVRKTALCESGLLDCWPRSIVPDAPAKRLLARIGLRIRFVPSLMMVNREQCNLAFSHDFLKRQMLWTRLYHPHWASVVVHAGFSTLLLVAAAVWMLLAGGLGQWTLAAWTGAALVGHLVSMLALLFLLDAGVRSVLRRRGEISAPFPGGNLLKMPLAILLTQFVYLNAVLLATFQRRVSWRGITYHIHGPFEVTVSGDRPFEQPPAASNVSL